MSETREFQTEVSRLLDIVANALYSNREIFLRELISNASDACDRRRYEAIAKPELAPENGKYDIRLAIDTEARTLTISDSGIGMNRDELVENLGTIAHSGTRKLLDNLGEDKSKDMSLIGQFGVGFYSAFMVSDKVDVLSRKAGEDTGWTWSSDGKGSYTIDEALKDEAGTQIVLHLKDDAGEFLLEDMLKAVVKKYSDHISFPILLGEGEDAVTINTGAALWMRPKSEITDEQYMEFYHHVANTMAGDEPWETIHWKAEGAIEYTNLLFIPTMKPFDLYDPKRHHGVKLYVKRVFITDGVDGLVPPFLRFLKGVVDSEDLPLNISREMLQMNPVVSKISSALTRKVLGELQRIAEKEPERFEQFWAQFGAVVKEGLYEAHAHRDALTKVVRFYSTKSDKLVSLEEYVSRMKDGQEHIYYISGADLETLKNSPQLEAFRAKDIEVLFMTDTIDEFWLPVQMNYQQKDFKSVTRGASELSKVKSDKDESDKKDEEQDDDQIGFLTSRLKTLLSGEVKDVVVSERLVDSPVCLVAPEGNVDIRMQRLLKKQQGYEADSEHVLEINPKHPVIRRIQLLVDNDGSDDVLKDAAFLLLDQARIIEGEPLKNPAEFARRMSKVMEKGLLAG